MKVFWIISEQIKREKRERDRSVRLLVTSVLAVGVLIKSTGSDFVPSLRDRVDPAASQDLRLCLCVCNIPNWKVAELLLAILKRTRRELNDDRNDDDWWTLEKRTELVACDPPHMHSTTLPNYKSRRAEYEMDAQHSIFDVPPLLSIPLKKDHKKIEHLIHICLYVVAMWRRKLSSAGLLLRFISFPLCWHIPYLIQWHYIIYTALRCIDALPANQSQSSGDLWLLGPSDGG